MTARTMIVTVTRTAMTLTVQAVAHAFARPKAVHAPLTAIVALTDAGEMSAGDGNQYDLNNP